MFKRMMQIASVFGFVALAACSSGSGDEGESSDQALVAPGVGHEGGFCGGIAGIRCDAGLHCKLSGSYPDASGTCVRDNPLPGHLGGTCGGFAAIQCLPGLTCHFSSGVSPAGLPGPVGPVGTDAGSPNPPVVGVPIMPDESGVCVHASPPPGWVGMPAAE